MHYFLCLEIRQHLDNLCSVNPGHFNRKLVAFGNHVCKITVFAVLEYEKQKVVVLRHTEQLDDERMIQLKQ